MWTCEVSYSLTDYFDNPLDEQIDEIAKRHSGEFYASGAGFGCRDVAFDFRTEEDAKSFSVEVSKLDDDIECQIWSHDG